MMSKQDHIAYWVTSAEQNWKAIPLLFDGGCFVEALFWAHLVLEKLMKAHWVKDNPENVPPKTHNLVKLAEGTKLDISEEEKQFYYNINQFQIEGRYPDYLHNLYKKYKKDQTKKIIEEIETIRTWLLNKL